MFNSFIYVYIYIYIYIVKKLIKYPYFFSFFHFVQSYNFFTDAFSSFIDAVYFCYLNNKICSILLIIIVLLTYSDVCRAFARQSFSFSSVFLGHISHKLYCQYSHIEYYTNTMAASKRLTDQYNDKKSYVVKDLIW